MSDGAWPPPLYWPDEALTDGTVIVDRFRGGDLQRVVLGAADVDTQRWLPLPHPYGEVEARAFLDGREQAAARGEELTCAFRGREDGLLAGAIGLSQRRLPGEAAIGYWTVPDRRGRGWTARAVLLLARYAFSRWPLRRIEILVDPANDRSAAVATAAGAVAEGLRRNGLPTGEGDALIFSLLPADVAGTG
jgi:RimJ/RimL family protein N-acetyltransferase